MGWDAFAVKDGTVIFSDPTPITIEPFVRRAVALRAEGLTIDFMLPLGGLDVSTCGHCLEVATGASVYGDDWSADETRRYAAAANWELTAATRSWGRETLPTWAKRSARAFLEACAEAGCGVRFSW